VKPLILLMDDNEDYRRMLRDVLEKRGGYRVVEADSPQSALEALGGLLPQVAIVDMYVSGDERIEDDRAGLGLVQELEGRGVPSIVLTAHDEDASAVRDALVNARFKPHGYLFKSDGSQAVLQKVAEVLATTAVQRPWYRSRQVWLFAGFSAFMAVGLYIAITTEHAQLLGVVVIGVLIEIVATLVLRFLNF